jgi:hypothetical protein
MSIAKDRESNLPPTLQQQVVKNKIFFRLQYSYRPFFQAMAEDYYQRGKIDSPSIGLLAKACLMTAGNAWNRMMLQLMTQDFEKKWRQKIEQERHRQQKQPQNYQQRREFVQTSGDLGPQSVATKRPPPSEVEETERQLQQEAGNLVSRSMTEPRYPTFNPRLDTSSMSWKPQQHLSEPRLEDEFHYAEDNRESQ